MEHQFHIFLHISLFGAWMGSVVALLVLLLCLFRGSKNQDEERLLLQYLGYVQRVPKAALILMLPMGLQLANNLAFITLGGGSMLGVWIFAIIWLAIDWVAAPSSGTSTSSKAMRIVERVLQATFVLLLLGAGILSHLSGTPVEASWLATKLMLFASALVIMSAVDILLEPLYRSATAKYEASEAVRKRAMLSAAGLLVLLLALLFFAAWTGFANWRLQ